jgi:hypothetical protein
MWNHGRPSDCKEGESPMRYLKKYLLKAQYDETAQFQYWIYNASITLIHASCTAHPNEGVTFRCTASPEPLTESPGSSTKIREKVPPKHELSENYLELLRLTRLDH